MGHALLDKEIGTTLYICDLENDYLKMHKFSKEVLNRPISYQAGEIYDNTDHFVISKNNSYPQSYSLLEVEEAVFSTLKQSYKSESLILRLYNPYRERNISFKSSLNNLEYVKADELTKDEELNLIEPCGIKTLKIL